MKILVIGAGSVGGYFGGRLAAAGNETLFIARGSHLAAIRERGLKVNSIDGGFSVRPPAAEDFADIPPPDLILLCVKHKDTPSALPLIKKHAGPQTLVISLQNGVESEKYFSAAVPPGNIIGGIAYIGSELASPGVINHTARGMITLGEFGGGISERVGKIMAVLDAAGIKCRASSDIRKDKWEKLMWNTGFNGLCALTRLPARALLNHPPTRSVIRSLMRELVAVAHAIGVDVNSGLPDKYIENTLKGGEVIPSTLQDVLRGKITEIDIMNGKVVEEGAKAGIPVPFNETVWAAVSAMDAAPRK